MRRKLMWFKEFRDLRRKPEQLRGLHDLPNYAYPLDDYTIVQKDGALLCAFECAGLDLNSASVEELDAHRLQANRALTRLDDGFQYHFDLVRHPSVDYPARQFPDAAARPSIANARFNTRPRASTSRPAAS
jgi:type IV secretory pathway VirB4 component